MPNKNNKQKGYTIIETMIAVSLFLVVVMAGMGSLLSANSVQQKSQSMRSIMDNLSFIMEDMSRNLRTGYDYHCIDDGDLDATDPHSCANGGGISFKSTAPAGQWVYYIGTYNGNSGIFRSADGAVSFVPLTPNEVSINPVSGFSVLGAESPSVGNQQQPFVSIKLVGTITYKDFITPFSLQTSVSQRKVDI